MTALAQALPRPRDRAARLAYDSGLVLGGSLVIAALAQLVVVLPFTPVPISGQTLGVLLIGTAYGWRLGGLTLLMYLVQIAVGLPFAAGGAGGLEILTLTTASGGYLWGFLVAAVLMGWLASRGWDRDFRSSLGVMLLGHIVIYVFGITWLMRSLEVGLQDALVLGLAPFVVGDTIKLLLAAGALPLAWRIVRRREE